MIEAVIFDMDGVLINSERHWQLTEQALFRELGIELTDELLVETRGLRTEEMVSHWSRRFDLDSVDPAALMKQYDERMLKTMKSRVELMDGALEAIGFFREKKLHVALATCSSEAHIEAALERHGIRALFDLEVSAAHRMQGKPHPEVYLRTAELLGVIPEHCLAIEDSFYGLIAARAARMKVVVMPDPAEYGQERFWAADVKIRSLRELNDSLYDKLQKL